MICGAKKIGYLFQSGLKDSFNSRKMKDTNIYRVYDTNTGKYFTNDKKTVWQTLSGAYSAAKNEFTKPVIHTRLGKTGYAKDYCSKYIQIHVYPEASANRVPIDDITAEYERQAAAEAKKALEARVKNAEAELLKLKEKLKVYEQ